MDSENFAASQLAAQWQDHGWTVRADRWGYLLTPRGETTATAKIELHEAVEILDAEYSAMRNEVDRLQRLMRFNLRVDRL
jgi:hypothetical protein